MYNIINAMINLYNNCILFLKRGTFFLILSLPGSLHDALREEKSGKEEEEMDGYQDRNREMVFLGQWEMVCGGGGEVVWCAYDGY